MGRGIFCVTNRGCWRAGRLAPPSKPEQTTKGLQKGTSEAGQFEFGGTVEIPILSPPAHSRPLSLQVTSCNCWQHCTDFFLLRYAVIANGIHVFAILRHPAWVINSQQYFNLSSLVPFPPYNTSPPTSFLLPTVEATAPDFVLHDVWVQVKMSGG